MAFLRYHSAALNTCSTMTTQEGRQDREETLYTRHSSMILEEINSGQRRCRGADTHCRASLASTPAHTIARRKIILRCFLPGYLAAAETRFECAVMKSVARHRRKVSGSDVSYERKGLSFFRPCLLLSVVLGVGVA